MRKRIFFSLLSLAAFFFLTVFPVHAQSPSLFHAQGQLLIKFKPTTPQSRIDAELKAQNSQRIGRIAALDTLVIRVPEIAKDKILQALAKNPYVDYAEEDGIATALDFPATAPNDPNFSNLQWGLENTGQTIGGQTGIVDADIDAQTAWQVTTGTSSAGPMLVAVLDTGIDPNHPDLATKISLQKNFTDSPTLDDLYGHGTHVSGILAAQTNNSTGVAGTCPACRLLVGKVLNDSGSGAYSWIANGIIWATDNKAKVISMSLGGPVKSATLENAINYAWDKGVVVVAAAGNSANQSKTYPGAYTNVIAVAATDNKDKKASFSSFGNWVDVAAPGVNIFSTLPTHAYAIAKSQNYDYLSGTSMATPMVAGTAALVWTTPFGTSATSVRNRLEATADKIPGTGAYWQKGRINAAAAVHP